MNSPEETKKAINYAVNRLAELGYIDFSEVEARVAALGRAFYNEAILVTAEDFKEVMIHVGDLTPIPSVEISMRPPLDYKGLSKIPHGYYRKFEKRDKRKNFRR